MTGTRTRQSAVAAESRMQQSAARLTRDDRRALRVLAGLPPRDARPILVVYGIGPPAVAGRPAGKRAPQPHQQRRSRWSYYVRADRPQEHSVPRTPVAVYTPEAVQARHVRVGVLWLDYWHRCGRDAGTVAAAIAARRLRGHLRRHIASVRMYMAWMSDQWVPWDGQSDGDDLRAVRAVVKDRKGFDLVAIDPMTREAVGVVARHGNKSVIARGGYTAGSARSPRLAAIYRIALRASAPLPTPAAIAALTRYVRRKAPLLRPHELAWALRVCAQMERDRREALRATVRDLHAGGRRPRYAARLVANRRERRRLARAVIAGVYERAVRALATQAAA